MSSVVNKSKNKFAPKAKARARTVASHTPAVESSPSVSATPAPAPAPAPVPQPAHITVDFGPPAAPAPGPSGPPSPLSHLPSCGYDNVSTPSEPRNLGIPMLEDETIVVRLSAPPLLVDGTGTSARQTKESNRGMGIPQLEDDGIDWTGAITIGGATEKVKVATKDKPRPGEVSGYTQVKKGTEVMAKDAENAIEVTEEEAAGTAAKIPRARKAPAVPRKRKAAAPPATPVTNAGDSPKGSRRSARSKKQNSHEGDAESNGGEDDSMDDVSTRALGEGDEDEGDEYVVVEENQRQPKKRKPGAKKTNTKAKAKKLRGSKEKVPRKPRAPRKPKEPGERRTRRAKTPEDAEERTIEEGVIKMKDLCSDLKIGKKSNRLKELEATDWDQVAQKQAENQVQLEEQQATGELLAENDEQRLERLANAKLARQNSRPVAAPQMRVVDGQLVLDEESLHVNRHDRDALEIDEMEIVEENVNTRLVNSSTWSTRVKGDRWEESTTERFFEGLSMFGTDFEMIARLFPGRNRRMIKNKFNCEERKNPGRITEALKLRVAVDLNKYAEIAGHAFPDPNQLEEELQQLREEHEAEADAQKEQAAAMERERQELANKAMRDAENGISTVQEQTGRKRKKKNHDASNKGEIVLGLSLEEYERERLLHADD